MMNSGDHTSNGICKGAESAIDLDLGQRIFAANGVPIPFNTKTTPTLYKGIKTRMEFKRAVALLETYLTTPNRANQTEFLGGFRRLLLANAGANGMEVLHLVFRESIEPPTRMGVPEATRSAENLRDIRQDASSSFQSLDKRANQLFSLLAGVLKAVSQTRMAGTRGML